MAGPAPPTVPQGISLDVSETSDSNAANYLITNQAPPQPSFPRLPQTVVSQPRPPCPLHLSALLPLLQQFRLHLLLPEPSLLCPPVSPVSPLQSVPSQPAWGGLPAPRADHGPSAHPATPSTLRTKSQPLRHVLEPLRGPALAPWPSITPLCLPAAHTFLTNPAAACLGLLPLLCLLPGCPSSSPLPPLLLIPPLSRLTLIPLIVIGCRDYLTSPHTGSRPPPPHPLRLP